MARRDFISYNTPERCAAERFWSCIWRRPAAPLRDWLPEYYKRIPVAQLIEIPREHVERTMTEFERNQDRLIAEDDAAAKLIGISRAVYPGRLS